MKYSSKELKIDGYKAKTLVQKYSTPLYCYSFKKIKANIDNFKKNFKEVNPLICFSVKSNSNKILLKEIGKMGLGADVVSIGELVRALKSGIRSNKIVFSGVGKTANEIDYAIKKKILLINTESKSEILEIEKIAKYQKKTVDIGIRLNPNIDAETLNQISTGKKENKFGVLEKSFINLVNYCKKSKYLNLKCLSVHIGSQILNIKPYQKMLSVLEKIIKKTKYHFEYIDLGGGMGIDYKNNNKELDLIKYSSLIKNFQTKNNSKIIFEPGRSIIADTAILITQIIYIKPSKRKNFIILDAAMNDLIRPALYGSHHRIIPVKKNNSRTNIAYEFVGPICETTDKFLTVNKFQKLREKEILAICDVGAYGIVLSSNYNLRVKPQEILVSKSSFKLISKKQNLNDII
jgi:diaminopimelate decarboxylase